MRLRFNVVLTSALVSAIGFITLLGLLVGDELGLLSTLVTAGPLPIRSLATFFLRLAVVTLAFSVLLGVLNLLAVHLTRLRGAHGGKLGSLALLLSLLGTLALYLLDARGVGQRLMLNTLQGTLEASLAALTGFALIYGACVVTVRRPSLYSVLFVAAILLVLISALPISQVPILSQVSQWLMNVPVTAGARGILIGIALATLVTGLRVLLGQDRSYGE